MTNEIVLTDEDGKGYTEAELKEIISGMVRIHYGFIGTKETEFNSGDSK